MAQDVIAADRLKDCAHAAGHHCREYDPDWAGLDSLWASETELTHVLPCRL